MNKIALVAMVAFYLFAGSMHFINPGAYLAFMPPYLPSHLNLIYLSGVFEIIFALLLIPNATRRMASLFIIALLIAIFPANVHMAIDYTHTHHPYYWLAILRLPLQLVLIWFAWKVGKYKSHKALGLT